MTFDSGTVQDAVSRHLVAHGLPADGGAGHSTFVVKIGSVALRLPNPPARQRAVFFHDVNHVLTGYNTVFSEGEMEIASYEVGSGCGSYLMVWYINLSMMSLGAPIRPRAAFRAFVRGRRAASIYRLVDDPTTIGAQSVGELRAELRIDERALQASFVDLYLFVAYALAGALLLFGPPALLVYGVIRLSMS